MKPEIIDQLRNNRPPIIATWSVGDSSALGVLDWQGEEPTLVLFVDHDVDGQKSLEEPDHPIFLYTKPPLQANIYAATKAYGTIILEKCARFNVASSTNFTEKKSKSGLRFSPTRIWTASKIECFGAKVSGAVANDRRLAGLFGAPLLKRSWPGDANQIETAPGAERPEYVFVGNGFQLDSTSISGTDCELNVSTNFFESYSATLGSSIMSMIDFSIRASSAVELNEVLKIFYELELMISVFTLESFELEFKEFQTNAGSLALVWRLGERRQKFQPPMRHQVLIDFSDRKIFSKLVSAWFNANDSIKLSRWLFAKALREMHDGVGCFIATAQAFEVLGRATSRGAKLPKSRLNEAAELIKKALQCSFDEEFVERCVGLIRSSNKASFPSVLTSMLSEPAELVAPGLGQKIGTFCRKVSETRNAIVHMAGDDESRLSQAFDEVNKLSLLLCFWYAVHHAHLLKIEVPNILGFLGNNRNARHGLPNEILDR